MKNILILFLIFISHNLNAQDYFQQEVNYTINVELNDENHTLEGDIYIDYTNNSPDKLGFIWFHIWPNAYKNNSTALCKQKIENGSTSLYYAKDHERGYIEKLSFKVNGKNVLSNFHPEHIDICKIILNKPLNPGESIRTTPGCLLTSFLSNSSARQGVSAIKGPIRHPSPFFKRQGLIRPKP